MTTETRYTYSREEIPQALAPALICETFGGSRAGTGSFKRKFAEAFAEDERRQARAIVSKCNDWTLRKGSPQATRQHRHARNYGSV